jgi:hypothetical protein
MEAHVRIFGWKKGYGLVQDSAVLGRLLEGWRTPRLRVEHCDPLTWMPPREATGSVANIHIYMENPCRLAMPWATYNVMVVNPEWFYVGAWDWCCGGADSGKDAMDMFVFKDQVSADGFRERYPATRTIVLPWTSSPSTTTPVAWTARERRFLYLIGGSVNKAAAAESIVRAWKATWPPLEIWCSPAIADNLRPLVSTEAVVEFQTEYRPAAEREARQAACAWHVVASEAEGFGYTMAEAATLGVPVLWTDLPVYRWTWGAALGAVGRISVVPRALSVGGEVPPPCPGASLEPRLDGGSRIECVEAVRTGVESLLALTAVDVRRLQEALQARRGWSLREFRDGWGRVLRSAGRGSHASGVPQGGLRARAGEELPMVGVVTVTRNRRAWWPNMVENIQRQRWPVSRLVWVLVDDGDEGQRLKEEVESLHEKVPALSVLYMQVPREDSLGAKRNAGVAAAAEAGATYAVMMDDDDHYPDTSVAERMRWLLRSPGVSAVGCSTIPMYDITRYISAMNVPPLKLGSAERVSEATVAFHIPADGVRWFSDKNVAEGDGWVGTHYKEIPPMGIIVSFIHSANTSSRRVPEETEANGCHYGFGDEYFRYLHTIGGVLDAE